MAKLRESKAILATYRETVVNMINEKTEAKGRINSEIEKLTFEIDDVKNKINESVVAGDNEAFKQLSDQRNFCELRIKYLQEQLKLVPNKTASESESNDFARDVLKLAKKANEENTKKAKALIEELQALLDDSAALAEETNNILNLWNAHVGDITIGKSFMGNFFGSDLADMKHTIERNTAYKRIRDGVDIV